ncbi:MAG TPA: hypothetical protein VFB00_10475, partial [Terriglobales bacterium]|nr:hypothetical protein [Terriglobales bacterium]
QEAKEIPTVNVLDPALLPEKHSFPPRAWITAVGTIFSLLLASLFVIGSEMWKHNQSPEKQLAAEIWSQMAAADARPREIIHRFWSKIGRNGTNRKAA